MNQDSEYLRNNQGGESHDLVEAEYGIVRSQFLFLGVAALNFTPLLFLLWVASQFDAGVKGILEDFGIFPYLFLIEFLLVCLAFWGMSLRNKDMYTLGRFLVGVSIFKAGFGILSGISSLIALIPVFGVLAIAYSVFWVFLSVRWFEVSAREFSSESGAGSKEPQAIQVAPDAEAKLKRSQRVLIGIAGAYLLSYLAIYFFYTLPSMKSIQQEMVGYGEVFVGGYMNLLSLARFVVVMICFALVYFLMWKRLKVGRIIGYVVAGFAGVVTLEGVFYNVYVMSRSDGGVIMLLSQVVLVLLLILWVVFVSHKSVSSILR